MIQLVLQEAASLLLDDGWPEGRELAADDTAQQHWRLYLDQCVQSSGRPDHGMEYDLLSSNKLVRTY